VHLEVLTLAVGIFVLRVVGNMLTTLRTVMLVRGQKVRSSILAVFESLVFAVALGSVVSNLGNIANLTAYVTGYAVGGYLGLVVEDRLIQKYVAVHIISPRCSHDIAQAIRDAGYGATENWGMGASGEVGSVTSVVVHMQVKAISTIVQNIDRDAFIMMEELRGISRGYFRRQFRPER
jgi:uncharacterized protein YebE (UPF0316 family)